MSLRPKEHEILSMMEDRYTKFFVSLFPIHSSFCTFLVKLPESKEDKEHIPKGV